MKKKVTITDCSLFVSDFTTSDALITASTLKLSAAIKRKQQQTSKSPHVAVWGDIDQLNDPHVAAPSTTRTVPDGCISTSARTR